MEETKIDYYTRIILESKDYNKYEQENLAILDVLKILKNFDGIMSINASTILSSACLRVSVSKREIIFQSNPGHRSVRVHQYTYGHNYFALSPCEILKLFPELIFDIGILS